MTRPRRAGSKPAVDTLDRWQSPDGTAFLIRPMRSDDAALELAFLDALSPQTRYERTFSHRNLLAPGELKRLVRFDVREEIALVALHEDRERAAFVAVARLRRPTPTADTEFAIVVGDAWQRRGIGLRLLTRLLDVARLAGLPRVVGHTFATNVAMKSLAVRAGFTARPDPDDATVTLLEIDLGPAGGAPTAAG